MHRLCRYHQDIIDANKTLPLINAIRKYGWKAFSISTLKVCRSSREAYDLERRLIPIFRASYDLYNISDGGQGPLGNVLSQETRKKMSIGVKLARRNFPERWAGIIVSDETRRKRSASLKNHWANKAIPEYLKDNLKKMWEANKKRGRPIIEIGNCYVVEYHSVKEAIESTGISRAAIQYSISKDTAVDGRKFAYNGPVGRWC